MKLSLLPTLLFLSLLVIGCSSGTIPTPTPTPTPAPVYTDVTGNWEFGVQVPSPPNFTSGLIFELSGALASSGPKVTGTLHARGLSITPCVTGDVDIPVTGTIDTGNNLTLNASIAGGTATLTTVVTSAVPLLSGTFTVTGGTCAQPSVSLTAFEVANVTGTYAGTLTQIPLTPTGTATTPAPTIDTTAALTQSSTPDAHGIYALTGTITTTGPCAVTIAITAGSIAGQNLQSYPYNGGIGLISVPPNAVPQFTGAAAPFSLHNQLLANINVPTGCPGFAYTGVLTRS